MPVVVQHLRENAPDFESVEYFLRWYFNTEEEMVLK